MANEFYSVPQSRKIVELIDRASNQVGLSRGQVFEDFLTFVRCSLAGQTMEEEYLATVAKGYGNGQAGHRAIDTICHAFAEVVNAMEHTRQDVLGDVFTGAISYGERGQFFTPDTVCSLMAGMNVPQDKTEEVQSVCDPACGSGRLLLAVGKLQPHWEFTGQDVDHRAAQMCAINLALFGHKGWAVWQNTLTVEVHRVYKVGLNFFTGGAITEVPVQKSPFRVREANQPVEPAKELTDQELARMEFAENFQNVAANPTTAQSRDLHRAMCYLNEQISALQRKSWDVPQQNEQGELIESLQRECDWYRSILKERNDLAGAGPYSDEQDIPVAKAGSVRQLDLF